MFEQSSFDPTLWPEIVKQLEGGAKVGICYGAYGKRGPEVICSTAEELANEVYETFRHVWETDAYRMVWGLNGRINPIKESATEYCDGMTYWRTQSEFLDCLREYTIERIYSFLTHYRYAHEQRLIS